MKRKFVTLCCCFELSARKVWWWYWKIADLRPPLGICPQLFYVHFLRHNFLLNQKVYYTCHKIPYLGRIINSFTFWQIISVRSCLSYPTINVIFSKVFYPLNNSNYNCTYLHFLFPLRRICTIYLFSLFFGRYAVGILTISIPVERNQVSLS